jgi:hypothetical protein
MDSGDRPSSEDAPPDLTRPEAAPDAELDPAPEAPAPEPVSPADARPEPPRRPPAPARRPSLSATLRVVFFLGVLGCVGVLAGRRWADAYARFCGLRAVDVSGLLAPETPAAGEGAPRGVPDKQPRAVVFRLRAPEAKGVLLGGSFNEFDARKTPLTRGDEGAWETTLALEPGRYLYKFKVDGQWILDPANPDRTPPPREASVLDIQ